MLTMGMTKTRRYRATATETVSTGNGLRHQTFPSFEVRAANKAEALEEAVKHPSLAMVWGAVHIEIQPA